MNLVQRYKRLTFWNKFSAIGTSITILSAIIWLLPINTRNSPEREIITQVKKIKEDQNKEIALLEEKYATNLGMLCDKYSHGYAIVYSDINNAIVYVDDEFLNRTDVKINLSYIKIGFSKKLNCQAITCPSIFYAPMNITLSGTTMCVRKEIGDYFYIARLDKIGIRCETVYYTPDRIIAIVGIMENNSKS